MPNLLALDGCQFERLTVIKRAANMEDGGVAWLCRCSCGTEVIVRSEHLRYGRTRSCGCLRREVSAAQARAHSTTHGRAGSPEHSSWHAMLDRCRNPNSHARRWYADRGITVCARWDPPRGGSFQNFFDDMGPRPEGRTLDRIDNDGNYEPGNCRWATLAEQGASRRKANQYVSAA
jgi:hypothetical protein